MKGGAWTREPLFARLDAEIRGDGASIRMDGPLEFAATAQAGRTSEGLNAVVVFTNAPLQMIRSGRGAHVDGRAHGEMHFAGTPSDPGVTGWAELSGGGVVSQPPRRLDISSARLEWSFRGGRARVSYAAQSDGVGRVEGEVVTPIEFGVVPWRFRLPKPSDARLAVRAEADVGRLARVLRNDDGLDVRGQMSVNVEARGELSRPVITGRIEVVGGELDHPPTGTSLREGVVRLAGDADSLRIVEAGVRDRAGGSILFGGSVSLNRSAGFPLAVTGRLARADVYGTPRVNANLDGTIALRGTLLEPRLEGRLAPRDLEIRLLRTKPLGVALPRVDIGLADAVAPAAGPAGPTWRDRLALDLRVEMEDRFRVTGRGLASEWRGQLRIQGTASEPRISGRLQLARGRQMFLGRRFDLTSGSIQWSGVPPEEMMLDLAAESRAADVTAQVRVTGPVSRPAIELASEPALPTDEILSRILFGRGIETITPFQAVMLANGVRQLQGGNSVSMLERGREWLGVDQVGITQASGQGDATVTGVSVGKYVNDRVYVFGEKGVGEAEDRVTVSFELTPSLSLETESSPRIREGIRLRWRRDF